MTKKIAAIIGLFCFLTATANASETLKGAKKDYENFKAEMTEKLEKVEQELAGLKAKAKEKGSTAQQNAINEVEKTRAELKSQLDNVKDESTSHWTRFKKAFAESVDKLNSKIQQAAKD